MRTVLLLGCDGQLGSELQHTLSALGSVAAYDVPEIDFAQPDSLRTLVRKLHPAIIVNAAAYTAVDKAESQPDKARMVNAEAPGVLAEEAAVCGAIFVHYSTDYVFDGTKREPYVETDAPHPLSVYGRTKQEGELAAGRCRRHLVLRTSWVVGAHGKNFIKTMLSLAAKHESLRVVADQIGAPTAARLLADMTAEILSRMVDAQAEDPRWGLYHLTATGETSWNGLARYVIARAARQGMALKAEPATVAAIATAEYPTPAKRPANSRLDTGKLCHTFGIEIPNWTIGVDDVLDEIVKAGPT